MRAWRTLDGAPTAVIAHRGDSGVFPEHVMPGYQSALDAGADIIEPDLVASRDGVLFCRHDLGLRRSTDVAERAEFADRRRDGDFHILDFTAAEVDALRAVQPFSQRDSRYNRQFKPPRFSEMLDWAAEQAARRGRPVVLYPEMKHPLEHSQHGVDATQLLIEHCLAVPAGVEILLQCFCPDTLLELKQTTGLPVALLIDSSQNPLEALQQHGDWLDGLALSKKWLIGDSAAAMVDAIHQRGLRVDVWTLRDDQLGAGFDAIEDELRWFYGLGVDRLFADFPSTAVRVRNAFDS